MLRANKIYKLYITYDIKARVETSPFLFKIGFINSHGTNTFKLF